MPCAADFTVRSFLMHETFRRLPEGVPGNGDLPLG
jgi:hypothetical protein